MGKLCSLAGWAIFLIVGVGCAMQHGKRWEFGPHGFTRLLVAADGTHYRDGIPIDQLTLALHKSGQYETAEFAALGILAVSLAWLAREVVKLQRLEKRRQSLARNSNTSGLNLTGYDEPDLAKNI